LDFSIAVILRQGSLWLAVLEWVGDRQYHADSLLTQSCSAMVEVMTVALDELASGMIPLRKCHTLLADGGLNVQQLAAGLGDTERITRELTESRLTALQHFDHNLTALKCYLSVYSN
jgi:hypothetical protein